MIFFLKNLYKTYFYFVYIIMLIIGINTQYCNKNMINGHGVTEGDKNIILDYHNRIRQAIALGQIPGQPVAANMLQMNWDPELAMQAQNWANSCNNDFHDPMRKNSRFFIGQNLGTTWTTAAPKNGREMMADFGKTINDWFKESLYYRYGPSHAAYNIGHFTQMIWAETNLIGCGFSFYYDTGRGYTKKYVCNYGPGGNVLQEYPYIKGRPDCKRFNLLPSRSYEGLCVKPTNDYHKNNYNYDNNYDFDNNYIYG